MSVTIAVVCIILWWAGIAFLITRWKPKSQATGQKAAKRSSRRAMTTRPRIESYVWCCVNDAQSCQECKVKNGQEWKRKKLAPAAPLLACKSPEGCRCALIPIYDDEGVVYLEQFAGALSAGFAYG